MLNVKNYETFAMLLLQFFFFRYSLPCHHITPSLSAAPFDYKFKRIEL